MGLLFFLKKSYQIYARAGAPQIKRENQFTREGALVPCLGRDVGTATRHGQCVVPQRAVPKRAVPLSDCAVPGPCRPFGKLYTPTQRQGCTPAYGDRTERQETSGAARTIPFSMFLGVHINGGLGRPKLVQPIYFSVFIHSIYKVNLPIYFRQSYYFQYRANLFGNFHYSCIGTFSIFFSNHRRTYLNMFKELLGHEIVPSTSLAEKTRILPKQKPTLALIKTRILPKQKPGGCFLLDCSRIIKVLHFLHSNTPELLSFKIPGILLIRGRRVYLGEETYLTSASARGATTYSRSLQWFQNCKLPLSLSVHALIEKKTMCPCQRPQQWLSKPIC